ncbi:hypothetical protein [Planobispora takensis]|nr:hypothetical protein [Planobispora takensis]
MGEVVELIGRRYVQIRTRQRDNRDFLFQPVSVSGAPVSDAMNRQWPATSAYLSRSFAGPEPAVAHPPLLAGMVETAAAAVPAAFPDTTMKVDYLPGPGQVAPAVVR